MRLDTDTSSLRDVEMLHTKNLDARQTRTC